MAFEPEDARKVFLRLRHHFELYIIFWVGSTFLLFLIFLVTLTGILSHPESSFMDTLLPSRIDVRIARILGVIIGIIFIAYGQYIHSRHLGIERKLIETERKYRDLFELSPDPLFLLDPQGQITTANQRAASLLAVSSAEDLLGKPFTDFLAEKDRSLFLDQLDGNLRESFMEGFCVQLLRANRDTLEADLSASYIQNPEDNLCHFVLICRDITERRRLEAMLLEISERERIRMGLDLHDGICSELAGIAYLAEGLHGRLSIDHKEEAQDALEICSLLKASITQTRHIARGLTPGSILNGGLPLSLKELCELVGARSGVRCDFSCDESMDVYTSSTAIHLYRITQEALNNSISHGHPQTVEVQLHKNRHFITLSISDDGTGFSGESTANAGIGIAMMKYRCNIMGGSLSLQERSPRGTTVLCRIPIDFQS